MKPKPKTRNTNGRARTGKRHLRETLLRGDCVEVMRSLPAASVSAIACDPPYGLEFMGKQWDKLLAADRHTNNPRCRNSHGPNAYVAGKRAQLWHERWATEALRVAKPGCHLLAFGGTRTFHRLACALEDAGWEIRDCLMWVYGSGFPKSLDVSKAIDKAAGAKRKVVGIRHIRTANEKYGNGKGTNTVTLNTAPATDAAAQWSGWGTALKPAWEPIILARKPLAGTVAANVQAHGCGALNIDGCRIHSSKPIQRSAGSPGFGSGRQDGYAKGTGRKYRPGSPEDGAAQICEEVERLGRWPANLILSHHPECVCRGTKRVKVHWSQPTERETSEGSLQCKRTKRDGLAIGHADADGMETVEAWDCHPDCPVGMLGDQGGNRPSKDGSEKRPGQLRSQSRKGYNGGWHFGNLPLGRGDSGSAARFFYVAKASRSEREAGLRGHLQCVHCKGRYSRTHLDDNGREVNCARNTHPTVKPVALMRYLVRLITPPGGLVLDPLLGSGTTGVAAVAEGFRFTGIDQDRHYLAIARRRIKSALKR